MTRKAAVCAGLLLGITAQAVAAQARAASHDVAGLVASLKERAPALGRSAGMQRSFAALSVDYSLPPERYDDFVLVRLLFEATRDAGLWGLGWTITDREPESDAVWQQWKSFQRFEPARPTAYAECDELSALFAFLGRAAGVRGIGLLWPASNHTVAVWAVPVKPSPVRIVVPTTQIFLGPADMLGTKRFDPWRQKSIFEYTRKDVPSTHALPAPLFDLFLRQVDRYAGATDSALQNLRYLRESVFLKQRTLRQAGDLALSYAGRTNVPEDVRAYRAFAEDMSAGGK
jgi:hypothetical protein